MLFIYIQIFTILLVSSDKSLQINQHKTLLQVKDSRTYNDYAMDIMKGGGRMYCLWNGPLPALGVCHPETFQQLNRQSHNKARGFTDGYRFLQPWLGKERALFQCTEPCNI